MEKFKEIRVSIPIELYKKFKKCLEKEYSKPTEWVRRSIVECVKSSDREER